MTVTGEPEVPQQGVTIPAGPGVPPGYLSPEEVERRLDEERKRVRKEEKDKLYPELNDLKEWRKAREAEEEERQRQAAEAARAAEEARRKVEEADLSAKELIEKREREWQARLDQIEEQGRRDRAIYEKDREMARIDTFRETRIRQAIADDVIPPEMASLVRGFSEDEIESSIRQVAEIAEKAFANARAAVEADLRGQREPLPPRPFTGAPPAGPMEGIEGSQRSFTLEEINAMGPDEWEKYGPSLRAAAAQQYYEQRSRR